MSTKLAKIIADFRTTLATEIAVGGTSATLQSATDDDGVALPTGTYFFTIDGENSQKEHIVCTCTAGALTSISTVSRQGVQASGVLRKHRIGATVTITDFAHIMYINDLLTGTTDLNASTPLKYDGTATISNDNHLATKAYVDSVAVSGAPNASTTVKGLVEIATAAELAAGTATGGTGAILTAGGASFKSTSAGAGDANKVPVLDANGLLDYSFLPNPLNRTADQIQITTDADSANDPTRKSFVDAAIIAAVSAFATPGTSGEAWTGAGVPLYLKASDGKLYKTDADADESTFSFVGLSTGTVAGADVATTYIRPGGILTGLSGLTAGSYYFISGTAGTLAVTAGARSARVGQALSTTVMRVLQPKFIVKGTQVITSATTFVQTCGFYPDRIEILACSAGKSASMGDDGNRCIKMILTSANNNANFDGSYAWFCVDANVGTTQSRGTVTSLTQTGFTLSCATYNADTTIYWTAYFG